MTTFKRIAYSLSGGILLSLSWPHIGSITPLIFVAWIPFFLLEDSIAQDEKSNKKLRLWGYSYLGFLTWNLLTTWWIYFASLGGMLMANLANSLLMTIPFIFYHITKSKIGVNRGLFGFASYWICFEYLHLDWDLTWPWLTLGNVFAGATDWVQWYEYTGVFGGSIWVLAINAFLFSWLNALSQSTLSKTQNIVKVIALAGFILIPISISYWVKSQYKLPNETVKVAVLQPNVDPYAKFSQISPKEQVEKIIALSKQVLAQDVNFLIGPETSLPRSLREDEFVESPEYKALYALIEQYPNLTILTGMSSLGIYFSEEDKSSTARYSKRNDLWYDSFNTAVQINKNGVEFYHKSKLVPGVEKMPFPAVFGYLESFAINLGGTTGSLGMQKNREAFYNLDSSLALAPVICYESIYGEYVGEYLNAGADLIAIITNDGWWDDTPGYKQHLLYAKLRAIEHRKSIARAANTGTSAYLTPFGDVEQATNWWEEKALVQDVVIDRTRTFYSRFGDYLGRISLVFAPLLLLSVFVKRKSE